MGGIGRGLDRLDGRARRLGPRIRARRADAVRGARALPGAAFDLAVSYLSLIDIEHAEQAIGEMARVLRPGGALLVAHVNAFTTAAEPAAWRRDLTGALRYTLDDYPDIRATGIAWKGIRVVNWRPPLSFYFKALFAAGFDLKLFDEPEPQGGGAAKIAKYRRAPHFCVMRWEKR